MKKVIKTICNALLVILVVLVVSITIMAKQGKSVLGYKMLIVLSDSMSKTTFSAGDLIFVKHIEPTSLEVGDIVSYYSRNEDNYGEIITHKIRKKEKNGYVTYGTTTNVDDSLLVTYDMVYGKYQFSIPKVGKAIYFLKSKNGFMCLVFIPLIGVILYEIVKVISLCKGYKVQRDLEIQEDKKLLEHYKKENERLMNQLEIMSQKIDNRIDDDLTII